MIRCLHLAFLVSSIAGEEPASSAESPETPALPSIKPSETIPEYLLNYGVSVEEHWLTTDDGYILELFRLPNPGAPVILMQHGILCSAWHAVVNAPELSPGLQLFEQGYDIWLPNSRGNTYSKNHTTLDPSFNKEFWNFTWADMARLDVPANIAYILNHTHQQSLSYIGWSQGTTQFFVAMQDETTKAFIDKTVNFFGAMAPVTWMKHQKSTLFTVLTDLHIDELGYETIFPYGFLNADSTPEVVHTLCRLTAGLICDATVNIIAGSSPLDSTQAVTNFTAHFPAGVSMKALVHYSQSIRSGEFREFDYGKKGNLLEYGQEEPPSYDMSKIAVPTALFVGEKDDMGDPNDVEILTSHIGSNPALVHHRTYSKFSHMTFFLGTQPAYDDWFPDLVSLLGKYNPLPAAIV